MAAVYKTKKTENFIVGDSLSLFTGNGNVSLSKVNAADYVNSLYSGVIFDYSDENISYGTTIFNTSLSLESAKNVSKGFYNLMSFSKTWLIKANDTAKTWSTKVNSYSGRFVSIPDRAERQHAFSRNQNSLI